MSLAFHLPPFMFTVLGYDGQRIGDLFYFYFYFLFQY